MIKTAMLYALAGMLLSALWLVEVALPLPGLLGGLLRSIQPTALHLIVIGWLTQLIFGVAIWMFPPWSKARPRGPEVLNWSCYGLLNAGLLLRLIAEPLNSFRPSPILAFVLVVSAVLQVGAIWLFVALVWARVRGKAQSK